MNSFGRIFRVSIFGESHGPAIGITIDGCPPGIELNESHMEHDIKRRMPGAAGTTPRREADIPEIVSGTYNGKTTGAPITVIFRNSDTKSADYDKLRSIPRPGHADLTAMQKYKGFNDHRGGGHFSGRITLPLVAAGAVAKKIISGISVESSVVEIAGKTYYPGILDEVIAAGDSAGGIIEVRMSGVPSGIGEPFFDSVESCISHIVFSVPAVKGIEFGSGFMAAKMRGSEHNDKIISPDGTTETNYAGGINGGITNGNDVIFRVAVKPTPSIKMEQQTVNLETGKTESLIIQGRHDACIALRASVVFEACAAIAMADLYLINKS
jgi:chorismate synthase